jgi:hypothetical protein
MTRRMRGALGLIAVGVGLLLAGREGGPHARVFLTAGVVLLVIGLTIMRRPPISR